MAQSAGSKLYFCYFPIKPRNWKIKRKMYWIWITAFLALISIGFYSFQLYSESYNYYNPRSMGFTNNYFLENEEMNELGFIVDTSTCNILNISVWDKAVLPFMKPDKAQVNCHAQIRQWTYSEGKNLIINTSSVESSGYTIDSIDCCYMYITRVDQSMDNYDSNADLNILFSPECISLPNIVNPIPVPHEFIRVQCKGKYWPFSSDILYRQFHAIPLYPKNPETQRKADFWAKQKELIRKRINNEAFKFSKSKPPNVLIIGIDSMSRLSFHRNMPKTKKILEGLGAVEMLGYTKVGENTIPNAVPFLSGYSFPDLVQTCSYSGATPQDDCPYIWKRFSSANYITSFVEDAPLLAIFHYLRTGFVKAPVDYYFRPFMLGVHQHTPTPFYTIDCIGYKTVDEVLLKYIRELLDLSVEKATPLFLVAWLTNLAHQNMNAAHSADEIYADFVQSLDLNNTVLFFMSDHGYRYGGIRQTFPGWYEDKLPNFWIHLPNSIQKTFPSWRKSLVSNSRRLTSPYDLFFTMSHILDTFTNAPQPPAQKSPNGTIFPHKFGQSLFTEIPKTRECGDAGISDGFCACVVPKKLLANDSNLIQAAKVAVGRINEFLPNQCTPLHLHRVLAGAAKTRSSDASRNPNRDHRGTTSSSQPKSTSLTYIVAFTTEPGDFLFEANVSFESGIFRVTTDLLRMNKISTDVSCVRDAMLEKFCYCRKFQTQS